MLLGMAILTGIFVSISHHIAAQTYESIAKEKSSFKNNPQINLGGTLEHMAVNSGLNKVYVSDSRSNTVSVIDSNSGLPKTEYARWSRSYGYSS